MLLYLGVTLNMSSFVLLLCAYIMSVQQAKGAMQAKVNAAAVWSRVVVLVAHPRWGIEVH
jgi:hypothetical protein